MGSLWNRSGVIERYGADDLPARSAKAYFFLGGTTSPMTVFADAAEASAHPHPVVADSNGRWPNIFIPYTLSYDVQVVNEFNVELTYTQEIPNPDPVELTTPPGGGGGGTVEAGMTHWEPIQGTKVGYVRCNGRTIGNTVSGATERGNEDCATLFEYLWNALADAQAPVSSGRGGSAGTDFAAGKTIRLPDLRGALPVGLDNMGNVDGGFLGSPLTWSQGGPTTPGSAGGNNSNVLSATNIPSHTHTFSPGSHFHQYVKHQTMVGANLDLGASVQQVCVNEVLAASSSPLVTVEASIEATSGGSDPLNNVPKVITGTWYMKL